MTLTSMLRLLDLRLFDRDRERDLFLERDRERDFFLERDLERDLLGDALLDL